MCWKGDPGPEGVGMIDPNYQLNTDPLSPEDLAALLQEMQASKCQGDDKELR